MKNPVGWLVLIAVGVSLAALPPAASAQGRSSVAPDERVDEPWRPDGATALTASAVYPGLGQLLNGAEAKAAIVGAAEAILVAALVVEDRRTRNSFRMYEQTNELRYYDDYSEHFDNRQTLIWWAVVAALYGLTDAYVDANLSGFEDAPEPVLESSFGGDARGDELRLGLAFRF